MGATRRCDTVVGVFDTRDRAERAVAELHIAGYRDEQISTAALVVTCDPVPTSGQHDRLRPREQRPIWPSWLASASRRRTRDTTRRRWLPVDL